MWLTEVRKQYGLSVEKLGRILRQEARKKNSYLTVSDGLLKRLEEERGFVTVPRIANLIAEACGATAQQRDALVLPQYRGKWKPSGKKPVLKPMLRPRPAQAARKENPRLHEVVAVNRKGEVVAAYPSVTVAADRCVVSADTVMRRCLRRTTDDEYTLCKHFTFRYRHEWEAMSQQERVADANRTAPGERHHTGQNSAKPVTVITREGSVFHYPTVNAAATACGITAAAAHFRIVKQVNGRRTKDGCWMFFTRVWDRMTREERDAVIGESRGQVP